MRNTFLTYLKKPIGLRANASILLAVSGGVDSMVMLRLFEETPYRILVGHCNFSLRGEASDGDQKMIQKYCKDRGIPFVTIKFDTNKVSKERKISTQMAARVLRFDWFEGLMRAHGTDYLATAHHAEDSLETALLNITRGTGLRGLKGILPKNGTLIRPILFADREQVLLFAKQNEVKWREDRSNSSVKYKRNFIRHKVVPLLKEQNPNVAHTYKDTSRRVALALDFMARQTEEFKRAKVKVTANGYEISKTDFLSSGSQVLIEFWLEDLNFNTDTIQNIFSCDLSGSPQFFGQSHKLSFGRQKIFITTLKNAVKINVKIPKTDKLISLPSGHIRVSNVDSFPSLKLLKSANYAFLDQSKLRYPLILRNWEKGDSFRPYGMKGRKLVSDYLTDIKLPQHLKENVLVLCSNQEIIWLVNYRIADGFAIHPDTKDCICMIFE